MKRTKIISMLNMKGGVGKTTLTLNISKGLSNNNKILIIDLDPQSNTSEFLIKEDYKGLEELLLDPNKNINDYVIKNIKNNIDVLPSTIKLANTEMELRLNQLIPQHRIITTIIEPIMNNYDYIIIDCAPIINLLTINSIIASTDVYLPIKPGKFSIDGASITLNNIKQIIANFKLEKEYSLLFNMVDRNNIDKQFINDIKKLNIPIFNQSIRYQARPVSEAYLSGKFVIDSKAPVADDLIKLVEEIERREHVR